MPSKKKIPIYKSLGKYFLENGKNLLFFTVCWFLGINFLVRGYIHLNYSNPEGISPFFIGLSVIGLILILLPFIKRVKVGDIEIEREVEQAKREIKEFKTETRNILSVISTQLNTVANMNNQNQVTIYVPGYEEAKADLKQQIPQTVVKEAEVIKDELVLDNQDTIMAVVKLRVQLEYLLRKILGKKMTVSDSLSEIKMMSLLQLTRQFLNLYPNYLFLESSFDYVRGVGNAAAHAQQINPLQAQEAIDIGTKLIATLRNVAEHEGIN
jgi:hypothetical protein